MLYPQLYQRVAAVLQATGEQEAQLVEQTLVHEVLDRTGTEVDVHYHIPAELQRPSEELVDPRQFEVLTYSVVEDAAGKFTVFVEAAYETREPVIQAHNRPVTPADYETVTFVYHLRANLTPVMGKVQAKVFVAFEPLNPPEDA